MKPRKAGKFNKHMSRVEMARNSEYKKRLCAARQEGNMSVTTNMGAAVSRLGQTIHEAPATTPTQSKITTPAFSTGDLDGVVRELRDIKAPDALGKSSVAPIMGFESSSKARRGLTTRLNSESSNSPDLNGKKILALQTSGTATSSSGMASSTAIRHGTRSSDISKETIHTSATPVAQSRKAPTAGGQSFRKSSATKPEGSSQALKEVYGKMPGIHSSVFQKSLVTDHGWNGSQGPQTPSSTSTRPNNFCTSISTNDSQISPKLVPTKNRTEAFNSPQLTNSEAGQAAKSQTRKQAGKGLREAIPRAYDLLSQERKRQGILEPIEGDAAISSIHQDINLDSPRRQQPPLTPDRYRQRKFHNSQEIASSIPSDASGSEEDIEDLTHQKPPQQQRKENQSKAPVVSGYASQTAVTRSHGSLVANKIQSDVRYRRSTPHTIMKDSNAEEQAIMKASPVVMPLSKVKKQKARTGTRSITSYISLDSSEDDDQDKKGAAVAVSASKVRGSTVRGRPAAVSLPMAVSSPKSKEKIIIEISSDDSSSGEQGGLGNVMAAYTKSSLPSASNDKRRISKTQPRPELPPEGAVNGSKYLPWLELSAWETEQFRQRVQKNANSSTKWNPSKIMIERELKRLGRGLAAYRAAENKDEAKDRLASTAARTADASVANTDRHVSSGQKDTNSERRPLAVTPLSGAEVAEEIEASTSIINASQPSNSGVRIGGLSERKRAARPKKVDRSQLIFEESFHKVAEAPQPFPSKPSPEELEAEEVIKTRDRHIRDLDSLAASLPLPQEIPLPHSEVSSSSNSTPRDGSTDSTRAPKTKRRSSLQLHQNLTNTSRKPRIITPKFSPDARGEVQQINSDAKRGRKSGRLFRNNVGRLSSKFVTSDMDLSSEDAPSNPMLAKGKVIVEKEATEEGKAMRGRESEAKVGQALLEEGGMNQHPQQLRPNAQSTASSHKQGPISRPSRPGAWNPVLDSILMAAKVKSMSWASVQRSYFPTKTRNACQKRYMRLMQKNQPAENEDRTRGISVQASKARLDQPSGKFEAETIIGKKDVRKGAGIAKDDKQFQYDSKPVVLITGRSEVIFRSPPLAPVRSSGANINLEDFEDFMKDDRQDQDCAPVLSSVANDRTRGFSQATTSARLSKVVAKPTTLAKRFVDTAHTDERDEDEVALRNMRDQLAAEIANQFPKIPGNGKSPICEDDGIMSPKPYKSVSEDEDNVENSKRGLLLEDSQYGHKYIPGAETTSSGTNLEEENQLRGDGIAPSGSKGGRPGPNDKVDAILPLLEFKLEFGKRRKFVCSSESSSEDEDLKMLEGGVSESRSDPVLTSHIKASGLVGNKRREVASTTNSSSESPHDFSQKQDDGKSGFPMNKHASLSSPRTVARSSLQEHQTTKLKRGARFTSTSSAGSEGDADDENELKRVRLSPRKSPRKRIKVERDHGLKLSLSPLASSSANVVVGAGVEKVGGEVKDEVEEDVSNAYSDWDSEQETEDHLKGWKRDDDEQHEVTSGFYLNPDGTLSNAQEEAAPSIDYAESSSSENHGALRPSGLGQDTSAPEVSPPLSISMLDIDDATLPPASTTSPTQEIQIEELREQADDQLPSPSIKMWSPILEPDEEDLSDVRPPGSEASAHRSGSDANSEYNSDCSAEDIIVTDGAKRVGEGLLAWERNDTEIEEVVLPPDHPLRQKKDALPPRPGRQKRPNARPAGMVPPESLPAWFPEHIKSLYRIDRHGGSLKYNELDVLLRFRAALEGVRRQKWKTYIEAGKNTFQLRKALRKLRMVQGRGGRTKGVFMEGLVDVRKRQLKGWRERSRWAWEKVDKIQKGIVVLDETLNLNFKQESLLHKQK